MIKSEYLAGKRVIVLKTPAERSSKTSKFVIPPYNSGVVRAYQQSKHIKATVEFDNGKVDEVIFTPRNSTLFVEELFVEVLLNTKRVPALTFKHVGGLAESESEVFAQYFGDKNLQKIPKNLILPFNFRKCKLSPSLSSAVLRDVSNWLRIAKTKLLLLKGPYAVLPCLLQIYDKSGGYFTATLLDHNLLKRILTVQHCETMETLEVDPKVTQVKICCSTSDLDEMLSGNVMKKPASRKCRPPDVTAENDLSWKFPVWLDIQKEYILQYTDLLNNRVRERIVHDKNTPRAKKSNPVIVNGCKNPGKCVFKCNCERYSPGFQNCIELADYQFAFEGRNFENLKTIERYERSNAESFSPPIENGTSIVREETHNEVKESSQRTVPTNCTEHLSVTQKNELTSHYLSTVGISDSTRNNRLPQNSYGTHQQRPAIVSTLSALPSDLRIFEEPPPTCVYQTAINISYDVSLETYINKHPANNQLNNQKSNQLPTNNQHNNQNNFPTNIQQNNSLAHSTSYKYTELKSKDSDSLSKVDFTVVSSNSARSNLNTCKSRTPQKSALSFTQACAQTSPFNADRQHRYDSDGKFHPKYSVSIDCSPLKVNITQSAPDINSVLRKTVSRPIASTSLPENDVPPQKQGRISREKSVNQKETDVTAKPSEEKLRFRELIAKHSSPVFAKEYLSICCLQNYISKLKLNMTLVRTLYDELNENALTQVRDLMKLRCLMLALNLPKLSLQNDNQPLSWIDGPGLDWVIIYKKLTSYHQTCLLPLFSICLGGEAQFSNQNPTQKTAENRKSFAKSHKIVDSRSIDTAIVNPLCQKMQSLEMDMLPKTTPQMSMSLPTCFGEKTFPKNTAVTFHSKQAEVSTISSFKSSQSTPCTSPTTHPSLLLKRHLQKLANKQLQEIQSNNRTVNNDALSPPKMTTLNKQPPMLPPLKETQFSENRSVYPFKETLSKQSILADFENNETSTMPTSLPKVNELEETNNKEKFAEVYNKTVSNFPNCNLTTQKGDSDSLKSGRTSATASKIENNADKISKSKSSTEVNIMTKRIYLDSRQSNAKDIGVKCRLRSVNSVRYKDCQVSDTWQLPPGRMIRNRGKNETLKLLNIEDSLGLDTVRGYNTATRQQTLVPVFKSKADIDKYNRSNQQPKKRTTDEKTYPMGKKLKITKSVDKSEDLNEAEAVIKYKELKSFEPISLKELSALPGKITTSNSSPAQKSEVKDPATSFIDENFVVQTRTSNVTANVGEQYHSPKKPSTETRENNDIFMAENLLKEVIKKISPINTPEKCNPLSKKDPEVLGYLRNHIDNDSVVLMEYLKTFEKEKPNESSILKSSTDNKDTDTFKVSEIKNQLIHSLDTECSTKQPSPTKKKCSPLEYVPITTTKCDEPTKTLTQEPTVSAQIQVNGVENVPYNQAMPNNYPHNLKAAISKQDGRNIVGRESTTRIPSPRRVSVILKSPARSHVTDNTFFHEESVLQQQQKQSEKKEDIKIPTLSAAEVLNVAPLQNSLPDVTDGLGDTISLQRSIPSPLVKSANETSAAYIVTTTPACLTGTFVTPVQTNAVSNALQAAVSLARNIKISSNPGIDERVPENRKNDTKITLPSVSSDSTLNSTIQPKPMSSASEILPIHSQNSQPILSENQMNENNFNKSSPVNKTVNIIEVTTPACLTGTFVTPVQTNAVSNALQAAVSLAGNIKISSNSGIEKRVPENRKNDTIITLPSVSSDSTIQPKPMSSASEILPVHSQNSQPILSENETNKNYCNKSSLVNKTVNITTKSMPSTKYISCAPESPTRVLGTSETSLPYNDRSPLPCVNTITPSSKDIFSCVKKTPEGKNDVALSTTAHGTLSSVLKVPGFKQSPLKVHLTYKKPENFPNKVSDQAATTKQNLNKTKHSKANAPLLTAHQLMETTLVSSNKVPVTTLQVATCVSSIKKVVPATLSNSNTLGSLVYKNDALAAVSRQNLSGTRNISCNNIPTPIALNHVRSASQTIMVHKYKPPVSRKTAPQKICPKKHSEPVTTCNPPVFATQNGTVSLVAVPKVNTHNNQITSSNENLHPLDISYDQTAANTFIGTTVPFLIPVTAPHIILPSVTVPRIYVPAVTVPQINVTLATAQNIVYSSKTTKTEHPINNTIKISAAPPTPPCPTKPAEPLKPQQELPEPPLPKRFKMGDDLQSLLLTNPAAAQAWCYAIQEPASSITINSSPADIPSSTMPPTQLMEVLDTTESAEVPTTKSSLPPANNSVGDESDDDLPLAVIQTRNKLEKTSPVKVLVNDITRRIAGQPLSPHYAVNLFESLPELKSPVVKKKKKKYWYPKEIVDEEKTKVLQLKACCHYPSLSMCIDCQDEIKSAYCRFIMFRRVSADGKTSYGISTLDDAKTSDIRHWIFNKTAQISLSVEMARDILEDVGSLFKEVVIEEQYALKWADQTKTAWKRAVLQVREMCDECATSVFNTHWTCQHCAFTVCLDCFRYARRWEKKYQKRVENWPSCDYQDEDIGHTTRTMTLTQIIPKDVLRTLDKELDIVCEKLQMKLRERDLLEFSTTTQHTMEVDEDHRQQPLSNLNMLAFVADKCNETSSSRNIFEAYNRLESTPADCRWFCDERMLHVQSPCFSPTTMPLFRAEWRKGHPIIVSNVNLHLKQDIWTPQSFCRDFGHEVNEVINCFNGKTMEGFSVAKFWKGFESIADRPRLGEPVSLLKLKDWPSSDDFKNKFPERFNDIMQALPAPCYTARTGMLNLAARLSDFFAVPDLGPKMYNAYGSASYASAGTTNLHLDVSDATNCIVYVGIPQDSGFREKEIDDTLTVVDSLCCNESKRRIRKPGVKPGALWHIFPAHAAEKIRTFLRKVSIERGIQLSETSDPIHDQSFYLDAELLERLHQEEGVVGFAICQCLGDSVFIPAGAPHQVLNLHSCIKVAEDFVSPEHLSHCLQLTQEFRKLSDYHTNHEDKLQIKNILYHTVKDCVGIMKQHYNI